MKLLPVLAIAGSLIHKLSPSVYAQAVQWSSSGCLADGDVATIQCLVPLFRNVVSALLQIAAVALFIMFVVAGFNFIMGGGDPKRMEQAKGTMTYAVIGIVVMVLAYLIIQIIARFTGLTNLGEFIVPSGP